MKRILSSTLLLLALSLVLSGSAFAQRTVTGTVIDDETGEPLPGVNILLEGTQQGTQTDIEGEYSITIPEDAPAGGEQSVLIFSFIGYDDVEEVVGDREVVDVAMNPAVAELEAVVVSGYRTEPKVEATGSSARVGADVIEGQAVQSADAALQGRAAGVRVTQGSGQPGAGFTVQVRGTGSINAGTDPLYIVDGVQMTNDSQLSLGTGNPLAGIDPDNIASIEVLKDAAAKAIYGAQAANGVVLISTKRGRAGDTRVNFSTQIGATERIKKFDVLDANQYAQYAREAFLNNPGILGLPGLEVPGVREAVIGFTNANYGNPDSTLRSTDWQDEVFRTGLLQQYNLSVNGGTETTRFFVSGSFSNDEGQVIDSRYKQYGLQANLDHDIRDNLTLSANVNLSSSDLKGTVEGGAYINSPFWSGQFIEPYKTVYNINPETGEPDPEFGFNEFPNSTFSYNPVQQETYNTRESSANQVIGSVSLNWEILPGLVSRTYGGLRHEDTQERSVRDPRLPAESSTGGTVSMLGDRTTSFNISQTLPFDATVGEDDRHAFSTLAGVEYRREWERDFNATGEGLPGFRFRSLSNTASPTTTNSFETEFRSLSFFADGEYTFDERYIIRGTARYDGSSRFGENNKFGLFGAVSGGWRIANEAFIEDNVGFIDNLTLRGGYGVTGNSDIAGVVGGNYAALRLFSGAGEYSGGASIRPATLGNQDLSWEENHEINLGLDYALFGARISGSFDLYRSTVKNLLLARDLPLDSGYGSVLQNVGSARNQGLEISLSTVNLNTGGFRWDTDFNIAFQESEVLDVTVEDGEGGGDNEIVVGGLVYKEGEPMGQYRYARYAGVNPADGRPIYLDADGEFTYVTQGEDEQLVGNLQPDFYGGFRNSFAYEGLSLEVFFQYDYGRETLNNNRYFNELQAGYNRSTRSFEEAWREPGDITDVPILYYGGNLPYADNTDQFTERYIEDASYIRLKQLRLGYTLPASLTDRLGQLRRVNLFVQGRNLLTWTSYTGYDPEVVGTALGNYPAGRTLSVGLNLGL